VSRDETRAWSERVDGEGRHVRGRLLFSQRRLGLDGHRLTTSSHAPNVPFCGPVGLIG
jgi:hypothetical protein